MKSFLKKFLVILTILIPILSATSLITTTPTHAIDEGNDERKCRTFLGMVAWDCRINGSPKNEDELKSNIGIIATNISKDITRIAAYIIVGFTVYGGYLYLSSSGDANKTASGKKTLTNAFIGLAIVGLADVISNSIHAALLGQAGAFSDNCANTQCANPEDLFFNTANWFIAISGLIAVAFIVIGGINYITSSGDAAKVQKAKNTILYALIGLAIVGLSWAIVAFVTNLINNASSGSDEIEGSLTIILNGIILVSGLIAVIFIVIGGIRYITSTGDATKTQKAKSTLLFACIGLIICALAFAIVNFVISKIIG